ncbi:MAG TPA: Crp/Fnr family transcriptional regulator [Bacteroidales bacterium]|nr:Crp/Fnr family transcriptional regulator [Bacteroidales bacterium]
MYQRSKICKSCEECNTKSELFRLLTEKETRLLNEERFEVHFRAGENIIKQGTILTHVSNLVQGFAKIYIEGYDQRNLLLNLVTPNTILGGPGLFTDNRNHYTVTALEDSVVCFINAVNFKKVLRSNADFAEHFISHLNRRTIQTYHKILSLTQKQMHGKMADALIYLSENVYETLTFEIPLSRQDLADMTAMSKDSAIRILKEFERDEIATVNGKKVLINNIEALRELSERG